jgi:Ras-related protein Rab-5C
MSTNDGVIESKIVVVGDARVGKTSIVRRLSHNVFTHTYLSTIGVEFCFMSIGNNKLQIWDTAGKEHLRINLETYYSSANVVLYVFDITNKASFDYLYNVIADAQKRCSPDTVHYLVGNKSDADEYDVTVRDISDILTKYKLNGFMLVSSESGNCFEDIHTILTPESRAEYNLKLLDLYGKN